MSYKKLWKSGLMIFAVLLLIYVGSLTVVYLIPDRLLMDKWTESVNIIASEGKRWTVLPGVEATKLDTITDNAMFQRLLNREGHSPLYAGVWMDGYGRYWFGTTAFLRPLLLIMNYQGIRYFNIFFILGLLCSTFSTIKKHLGTTFSFAFLLSMGMIHVWIFPLSMQYTTAYSIMTLAVLILFFLYDRGRLEGGRDILFFLGVGSVTNFIDLLTVPLITFAFPCILYIAVKNQFAVQSFKQNTIQTVRAGAAWLSGYAITWLSKWILGSIILRQNLVQAALDQIIFRTGGEEETPIVMPDLFNNLIDLMFPSYMVKVLAVLVVVWFVYFIFYKKPWREILSLVPILFMAVLPYAWFYVLSNHNVHHGYFTYRNQAITVFAVASFMILSIKEMNVNKFREKLFKRSIFRRD